MKGIPNMGNLMKQAQQFQTKMAKLQEELGQKTVEASSGGGMVTTSAASVRRISGVTLSTCERS